MTNQFFITENFKDMRILLLFLFFISAYLQNLNGQIPANEQNKWFHLSHLKEGVLFIQLPNAKKKKIQLLEKSNNKRDKRILRIEKRYIKKHEGEIRNAFKNHFDYTQVYFFKGENAKKILAQDYDSVLINHDGKLVNPNLDSLKYRYIGYYGRAHVAGDTNKYNSEGIQINFINNGKLEGIESSTFYSYGGRTDGPIIEIKVTERWRKSAIKAMVIRLNGQLRRGRNNSLKFNQKTNN